eukprot:10305820-Alexandrium_andersonii.AAC.1
MPALRPRLSHQAKRCLWLDDWMAVPDGIVQLCPRHVKACREHIAAGWSRKAPRARAPALSLIHI